MVPPHIAVFGGGLTGLSSAFHLSRRFPNSLITLLEKQPRLGGWVRTERVRISGADNASVNITLEAGPRTLRPNAKSVLELINLLDLGSSIITVSKSAPAAKSRFLQIPETPGLIQIPSTVLSVVSSPLRSVLLSSVLREPFRRSNRSPGLKDESLDAFLTRRFGEQFARVFGSALVHGIYASDSRKLSVRAAFPFLWDAEERGRGSIVRGFLSPRKRRLATKDDYDLGHISQIVDDVSVYSFRDGMETLTKALERYLGAQANVRIYRDTGAIALKVDKAKNFEVALSSGSTLMPTHIVSTISLPALQSILSKPNALPHLTVNSLSSVTVVNFVFAAPRSQIHPEGFGYLIPRPASDYSPTSPSILGVVFDSCSLHAQDTPSAASFTKLTLMMGGPYPTLSAEHTFIPAILKHLEEHLQRRLPQPVLWKLWRNEHCIPTLMPGHLERMEDLQGVLRGDPWKGRLEVIGAGVGGVSVGDCIEAGKRAGENWT